MFNLVITFSYIPSGILLKILQRLFWKFLNLAKTEETFELFPSVNVTSVTSLSSASISFIHLGSLIYEPAPTSVVCYD